MTGLTVGGTKAEQRGRAQGVGTRVVQGLEVSQPQWEVAIRLWKGDWQSSCPRFVRLAQLLFGRACI